MGLYMLAPGSGIVAKCGLVGVGFNTLVLATWEPVFHQQTSDEDVELSAPPAPCLSRCFHALFFMIMD